MSLTLPPRPSAPLASTPSLAPTAVKPASATPARLDSRPGTFKDGYERSLNGANNRRANNTADNTFDVAPGKIADLVRDSRAARPSGGIRIEGNVRDALAGNDPNPEVWDGRFGGSNYRRNSREMG